jgi:hypothetical protein
MHDSGLGHVRKRPLMAAGARFAGNATKYAHARAMAAEILARGAVASLT